MQSSFDDTNEYQSQTFRNMTAQNTDIESKEFIECIFENCSFTGTVFKRCKFRQCEFKECDLSLITVTDSSFDAQFKKCKMLGIDWTQAAWSKHGFLNAIHFDTCLINFSSFMGLTLKKIRIVDSVAKDVSFEEADLSEANFTGTDFSESRFIGTNLTKADFTDATNYIIDASLNTLKKTKFSLPEAMSLLHSLDIILDEGRVE